MFAQHIRNKLRLAVAVDGFSSEGDLQQADRREPSLPHRLQDAPVERENGEGDEYRQEPNVKYKTLASRGINFQVSTGRARSTS